MDILYFVFAIISFILFMDGMLLKTDRFKNLLARTFNKENAKERVEFVSSFMVTTGIIALAWTVIGYLLYDVLLMEIFILVYFILIVIAGISLFFTMKTRFR